MSVRNVRKSAKNLDKDVYKRQAERLTNEVKKDILENENYIHYKMKGIVGGIYLK